MTQNCYFIPFFITAGCRKRWNTIMYSMLQTNRNSFIKCRNIETGKILHKILQQWLHGWLQGVCTFLHKIKRQQQWQIQDFPEEEAPTLQGAPTYDFAKISQKLHEIERIWAFYYVDLTLNRYHISPKYFSLMYNTFRCDLAVHFLDGNFTKQN